ncbi:MAG: hypothetical protein R6V49_07530 [Bacteroidales bacterium]
MSFNNLAIRPLAGFGDLNFGVNMQDIVEMLGQPEDSEVLSDGEDEVETLIWNYWQKGITLFIEGSENSVLSNCETDNREATLFDKKVFEMSEQGIIALMKENGFTGYETDIETWGEKRLSFEDAQIDFYFDGETLATVNWGVVVNNQGEII